MGAFGGDEAAADEGDARGQRVEIEKIVAGREMVFPRNAEPDRPRAGGDEDEARLERCSIHLDGTRVAKARETMEAVDAGAREGRLAPRGLWRREAALEGDQIAPVDLSLAHDALAAQAPGEIDGVGDADQHSLGIAAAQRADSAERQMIDDRDPPAGVAASIGGRGAGDARADDDEIILRRHGSLPRWTSFRLWTWNRNVPPRARVRGKSRIAARRRRMRH